MLRTIGLFLVLLLPSLSLTLDDASTISGNEKRKLDINSVDLNSLTCPTVRCAPVGPPVCAKRKGAFVLFPHGCALIHYTCVTNEEWEPVDMVKCATKYCPFTCNSAERVAVCATNGTSVMKFDSECEYRNLACKEYEANWSRLLNC